MHSFTPASVHKTRDEKFFRSPKRGKWGSLHVSIAWQIYYKEQLKKVHLKSKNLLQDSYIQCNLDPTCAETVSTNLSNRSEGNPVENKMHSHIFSLHSDTTETEWQKQPPNQLSIDKSREKDKKLWPHDRKRHLDNPSDCKVKRVKQEAPDKFEVSTTKDWSHTIPVFNSRTDRCTYIPSRPIPFHTADIQQRPSLDKYMKLQYPLRQNASLVNTFCCAPVFNQKWFLWATQKNCVGPHLWVPPASTWAYDLASVTANSHLNVN